MGMYARMDFVSGYQCLYGLLMLTEHNPVHSFCGAFVGFSGPQLMYRGEPAAPYPDTAKTETTKEVKGADKQAKVQTGRLNFDACHYYTHSPWFAATLFTSDKVLMADGTTDGGCKTIAGIPQNDALGQCPTASRVDADCEAIN